MIELAFEGHIHQDTLLLSASLLNPKAVPSAPPKPEAASEETLEFASVYRDYFGFVWRSARALGVGDAAMDDVIQETFLIVHRRLSEFEARSSLRTWISGIALNVVRRHRRTTFRKSPHQVAKEKPTDPEDLHAPERDPFEAAVHAEETRLLKRILMELDEPKREMLVLADLEGLSVPEIATVLEINPNTARSRLALARQDFEKKAEIYHRAAGKRT